MNERGQNLLVREWYVREQLLMDSVDPCRGGDKFYPFAPTLSLDDDTTLVTLRFEGYWTNYLVWRVESDYGFRWLTEEESVTVCEWNHRALRERLGFAQPLGQRTPPGYQGDEIM